MTSKNNSKSPSKLPLQRVGGQKPRLSFWQIWNMSFGFLGIQFGFALQNGNASRILLTFGADMEKLSWFWIAAPLTGLIIQPIIGHYSDQTWTKFGRRKPFFLTGAILAAIALILMPNAGNFAQFIPAMWVGAGFLMIMDASFNVAMEPFRALVADMLPKSQTTIGFSIQSALIGVGAVIGSWLPYIYANWFQINSEVPEGVVPENVIYSFYTGAIVLIGAILWTIVKTKEYSPAEIESFEKNTENEIIKPKFSDIFKDIFNMPKTMRQLSIVQFFTWLSLFGMWVFTTPAVAQHIYNLPVTDTSSKMFNAAGDWVGGMFGIYNAVGMVYAFLITFVAKKIGRKYTHSISLFLGAIGLISIFFITSKNLLFLPMIGIGIAWGSILSMPYAMLAPSLPVKKMGVYMGIFNIFITVPQIINGIFGGMIIKRIFNSQAIYALIISGIFLIIASLAVLRVNDNFDKNQ